MKRTGRALRGKTRGWIAGAIGFAAAASGGWLIIARPAVKSQKIAQVEQLRCAPEQDFVGTYMLNLHTKAKLNALALIADPGARGEMIRSEAGFSARLRVRVVERRANEEVLAMQLDRIEASSSQDSMASDTSAELGRPFFAVLDHGCGLSQTGFVDDLSADSINRLQAVTSGLSLALGKQTASQWTDIEHDSVGQYAARYERTGSTDGRKVIKRRTAYLRVHPPAGTRFKESLLVRVRSSRSELELDDEGAWLSRFNSREHLQMVRADGSLVVDLNTALSLERSVDDAASLELSSVPALRWRSAQEAPLVAEVPRPEPPDEMKTMPLKAALAQYMELLRRGGTGAIARAADFLALFLRAQPDQAFALIASLEQAKVPSDAESTVFLALELAGTQEAHAALVQGLSAKQATRNRVRAAAALPDVPNPSRETLAALSETAREALAETKDDTRLLRNSATYAVGALEQRAREKDPELARAALSELREQLKQARGPNDAVTALDAMGNSGNPALLADLRPHLSSTDVLVRTHAIEAMGCMNPQSNEQLFGELIRNEQDARVRGAIAKTYADQARRADAVPRPEVVRPALDALANESDPRVRGLLIDLIGPACASDPHAMQALAAQFRRESEPALLKLIGRYVPAAEL